MEPTRTKVRGSFRAECPSGHTHPRHEWREFRPRGINIFRCETYPLPDGSQELTVMVMSSKYKTFTVALGRNGHRNRSR